MASKTLALGPGEGPASWPDRGLAKAKAVPSSFYEKYMLWCDFDFTLIQVCFHYKITAF